MKTYGLLLGSLVFLTLASPGSAATIWDNGSPDLVNGTYSDFAFAQQEGDAFSVALAQTANQIQWWGGYGQTVAPPDNFTIRFFSVTVGVPATAPLFSYTPVVSRTDTGVDLFGYDLFLYSATIPDTLFGPGDYLLSIVNNTSPLPPGDYWYWASSAQTGTSWSRQLDGQPWNSIEGEFAFKILGPNGNGTGVPESGTGALLFGFGLAGLFFVQRRLQIA